MTGMANKALKGSPATILFVPSLLRATRTVVYTEPTANDQLTKNRQIVDAFAIADRLISARKARDSTSTVTSPS